MEWTAVQSRYEPLHCLARQKFQATKALKQSRIYSCRHDLKVSAIETKNPHRKGRDFLSL